MGVLLLAVYLIRPPCPIHAVTGLACPGCGVTRMVDALLRLDFAAAWGYNPFLMVTLPILAVVAVDEHRHPKKRQRLRLVVYTALIVGAIGFMVARNLQIW